MEVDYPRVTHPFAGLLTLAGFLPRLACVRHAASVRSEPGSNSPIIFIRAFVSWLADVTTYFAQSIAVSAIFFVDLLSGFQRPSPAPLPLRTTDCRPRLAAGRACYRCSRLPAEGNCIRPGTAPCFRGRSV